ncbi:IS66 family transposase [Legionella pneumophila]|uniref:IS66 family transposase n=1 Tax=Legionella pneumophila TaxID=446 RepID=UPI00077072EB|nr:transposase [Legionella pneumophila]CZH83719.1 Transposase and inactivated derivatives [Legionella pneumophila]CZJ13436.1 Transposase and inactivated derivatives [Legionella pneumophila]CZK16308.1 Transposase and inactivated derivatives [Legionella pneumophila]CZK20885.1 Transposase and inactivated derivatives [Legionella pneumophila]CZK40563.1 Transposase and inactivated derivatives [Legionella pneumophila]
MTPAKELPIVIEKSQEDVDQIIALVRSSNLPEGTKTFVIGCINLATWIPRALVEHKITVSNLKRLIFGKGDKATKQQDKSPKAEENTAAAEESETSSSNDESHEPKEPAGHGRLPHTAYINAQEHTIALDSLSAGQHCPHHCGGRLYSINPGILINIRGQNLASVDKYWIEKLRCALCNEVFSANVPPHVDKEKYHPSFKAMLALQKYYMAMPFHRQEYFQSLIGFPIPASTQWYLMEELAGCALLVFPTLEELAANGSLIHNNDTALRIIDTIRHNRLNPDKKRTGMYTTGILAQNGAHKIALFYNSQRHSGENMERLLNKRHKNNGKVIQMCDALSHNIPETHDTIVCNCLSHGFRKFDELQAFYPEHCIPIMKWLSIPFKIDEESKQLGHDEEQRLAYHQKHSLPAMLEAKEYMESLLSSQQVEPNESLGKAIKYMLKHWEKLTRFLQTPGAPIHNNDMERGLKIPIRGRNTWLFYKSEYGAMVGGVLTSIIYTCELSDINPFEYLIVLQVYKDQIVKEPQAWLPWNYENTLASLESSLAA